MVLKELAPAKINLYLDVLSKREDGYHEIETVMQTVDLCDELELDYEIEKSSDVTLKILGNDELLADESNLVIRAYRAFTLAHPLEGRLNITLNKRIPTAAGLGGGSADAAATLRALNKIAGYPISQKELLRIAESLGADVPFCLVGGEAICYGKGEKILPLKNENEFHVLIAKTQESVSTPIAYSQLDKKYADFENERKNDGRKGILESLKKGDFSHLYNIFDEPILELCPKAKAVKERMSSLGAKATLMSGSGPSVFGIFDCQISAKKAEDILLNELKEVEIFVAKSLKM